MNNFIQSASKKYFFLLVLFTLTGCSALDSYRYPSQPEARSLPQIPEIKRPQKAKPRYIPPKKTVVRAPKAQVSSSSYQIKNKAIVVKPAKPQLTQLQKIEQQKRLQEQAKQNATVDIDPFATIPDSSSQKPRVTTVLPENTKPVQNASSPAVKSLMSSARADITIGRSRSAISKLERGLRIEPQNAQIWHMLAKAHYANSAFLHSISMAKKSNSNTNNSDLINENWKLIKQAGEKSGNADAIKEALDYMKLNP